MPMTDAAVPLGPSDFLEWDVRNWSVALDFWATHSQLDLTACEALEIGSRHGGLSLWLASRGARVLCSDVGGPTDRARQRHRAAGLADRVRYASIDATAIPGTDAYDVVAFKSVLGAVGRAHGLLGQARAIREIHRCLKPGGELFFAENLVASPVHAALRRWCVPWGRSWRYLTVREMRALLGLFTHVRFRTVGFAGALGRSDRQRNILGRLDRAFVDRLVPPAWRYIIVGVARK
jgi:SAM-dependent methyltransferase